MFLERKFWGKRKVAYRRDWPGILLQSLREACWKPGTSDGLPPSSPSSTKTASHKPKRRMNPAVRASNSNMRALPQLSEHYQQYATNGISLHF
jgi:hypothetical protein